MTMEERFYSLKHLYRIRNREHPYDINIPQFHYSISTLIRNLEEMKICIKLYELRDVNPDGFIGLPLEPAVG
jgi:hypothetical protein